MKKIYFFIISLGFVIVLSVGFFSCSSTSKLSSVKSGAQLWGEDCVKCHNAPSPETFSDTEWDVAVMHMRVRANLTDEEANKIVEFMKTAN